MAGEVVTWNAINRNLDDVEDENDSSVTQPLQEQGQSSYLRQIRNNFNSKLVWGGIVLVAIWVVGTIVYALIRSNTIETDDSSLSQCYVAPSCPTGNTVSYDKLTGFTNDTGWSSSPSLSNECCQICLPGTKIVNCFNASDSTCTSKTGQGDFDYLMFDQIWLPQLCNALHQGHDPTLTHLQGSACLSKSDPWPSNLGIHGLWPNYYTGFPACCLAGTEAENSYHPLIPSDVSRWDIWQELNSKWIDPTIHSDNNCSVCSMLNHEWQKHGACLMISYTEDSQLVYFNTSLALFDRLWSFTQLVNQYRGKVITVDEINRLYPTTVNILCDPKDSSVNTKDEVGVFLELQTCWNLQDPSHKDSVGVHVADGYYGLVDCAPASPAALTTPCPANIYFPIFELS